MYKYIMFTILHKRIISNKGYQIFNLYTFKYYTEKTSNITQER